MAKPVKARLAVKRTSRARPPAPSLDTARLVHELEVHQAELESQNDELRAARRDLETALARYTELFEFAPIGYATIDAVGVIQHINIAGARLLGPHRARIVGARFAAMIVREDVAAFEALAARVRLSERAETCEVRVRGDSGVAVVHVTISTQPHLAHGIFLALQDVTRRRNEEERLVAAERALREANQRKDEFLAMLSHELRNPLAPIRTSLFVLSRAEPGSAAATEAHQIVERQVTHLTRLVDDLLDVTRISRGKIQLRRERVDLGELVRRALDDYRAAFEASGIVLGLSFAPVAIWVDVDPTRIVQAVSNVLANALKFTSSGGSVEVALHVRAGRAELRIRDNGAGIAPELLPHVFEPFTQAPQTLDRATGGLGLGLAMVKALIELHGGSVVIASDGADRGAEIVIELPLAVAGEVALGPALPPVARRRVLIIEDQRDAAHILETALTMLGLEVRVASNGRTGLDVARAFRPEVVLCDLGLPGMDGYEVARAFRRNRELRGAYLVALSGYAQHEDVTRATEAGFSQHIAKPASLDTLVRVIASAPAAP